MSLTCLVMVPKASNLAFGTIYSKAGNRINSAVSGFFAFMDSHIVPVHDGMMDWGE